MQDREGARRHGERGTERAGRSRATAQLAACKDCRSRRRGTRRARPSVGGRWVPHEHDTYRAGSDGRTDRSREPNPSMGTGEPAGRSGGPSPLARATKLS